MPSAWCGAGSGTAGRGDGPVPGVPAGDLTVALAQVPTASAGQAVAEDDAVEVIGLVLKAAGQLPSAGQLDVVAVLVLPATDCDIGPRELGEAARQGQAALVPTLQMAVPTLGQLDDGVAHHPDVPPQLGIQAVVDERSEANPDLRSSQASTVGGSIGCEHIAK